MNKWPSSITLIRHGQSEYNVAKAAAVARGEQMSYVDQAVRDQDTPLTKLGELQATIVGQELERRHPEGYPKTALSTVFTSPYLRARQTTEFLTLRAKWRVVVEERIREIEFGILDGLTPDGVKEKYPEEVRRRAREGKYWYRPPGGESRPDVALRVHSFLDTLCRDYTDQNVAVVCHSVVVLMFRRLFERWGEREYIQIDRENDVNNCSITVYAPNSSGQIRLLEYNTMCWSEFQA